MLRDLKQYIIESNTYSGQGALWKSFLMHSRYTEYLSSVLDGFLKNFDLLAVGTPDLLCSVGHNLHIGDYSGIESNPYEDPDLIDLVASCIDPDHKGGHYGSYDVCYFVKEFCLNVNLEIEHERKLAESFISYLGYEGEIEVFLETLKNTPESKWEEINDELSDCSDSFVSFWKIHPSTLEKSDQLAEVFRDFPLVDTNGVLWNFTVSYSEDGYSDFDYDKDQLFDLLELYSPNVNDVQADKYDAVFDVFSTSGSNSSILVDLENKFINRKDVLF